MLLFRRFFADPLRCNGTFLELGALNGISLSNTLFFEEYLGWNGVLIEAQPNNAAELMKNRKKTTNYAMAVCDEGTKTVQITGAGAIGGMVQHMHDKHLDNMLSINNDTFDVPCAPLGHLLNKAGVKQLDLVSLDVEGAELLVLKTMDWNIPVLLWLIEVGHGDDEEVQELMWQHGYKLSMWNIREHCKKIHCPNNRLFVNMFWSRS